MANYQTFAEVAKIGASQLPPVFADKAYRTEATLLIVSVRNLPVLNSGITRFSKLNGEKQWTTPGTVHGASSTPRSYAVDRAAGGHFSHNSSHLLHISSDTNCSYKPTNPVTWKTNDVASETNTVGNRPSFRYNE